MWATRMKKKFILLYICIFHSVTSSEAHFQFPICACDLFLTPALQSLWGQGDYKQEMDEMLTEQAAIDAAPPKSPLLLLRDRTVRWQLVTMSLIYAFNQLSGMSTVSMQPILKQIGENALICAYFSM